MQKEKEILSTSETADFLGITRATLYRLIKGGKIIAYKWYGKLYFKKSQILESLEAHAVDPEEIGAAA